MNSIHWEELSEPLPKRAPARLSTAISDVEELGRHLSYREMPRENICHHQHHKIRIMKVFVFFSRWSSKCERSSSLNWTTRVSLYVPLNKAFSQTCLLWRYAEYFWDFKIKIPTAILIPYNRTVDEKFSPERAYASRRGNPSLAAQLFGSPAVAARRPSSPTLLPSSGVTTPPSAPMTPRRTRPLETPHPTPKKEVRLWSCAWNLELGAGLFNRKKDPIYCTGVETSRVVSIVGSRTRQWLVKRQ